MPRIHWVDRGTGTPKDIDSQTRLIDEKVVSVIYLMWKEHDDFITAE